jgi:predicted dehydrogenase
VPEKLKVAIIGYGKVGHIRSSCIANNPELELVCICDSDLSTKSKTNGVPFFSDWREVLDLSPDIVFICTTNEWIPEIAVEMLKRGIHTFCEKPPGRTVADVNRMVNMESQCPGIKLKFGFNHRYHQSVMDAKAIVDKKHLGEILWARGVYGKGGGNNFDRNWRNNPSQSGGGILIDQGIHMLDLLTWFCGRFDEVKSLVGQTYWEVPVEDNVFAIFRNAKGKMATIHSSATQWRHTFLLEICLERGYLTVSGILSSTQTYGPESLRIARCVYDADGYPVPNPQESIDYYDQDRSWQVEVEDFVRCIQHDQPVQQGNAKDALNAMELVHRIYSQDPQWSSPLDLVGKTED